MSAAREVAARVAACKAKADALLDELQGVIGELPDSRDDTEQGEQEAALAGVRAELEVAAEWVENATDYLTARSDDDDPGCCAHRRLWALIAAQPAEARAGD